MTTYGTATTYKDHTTGTVTVGHADDVIGVTSELWEDLGPEHRPDDESLVLDTAGEYRYQLVGETTDGIHIILIFERIRAAQ